MVITNGTQSVSVPVTSKAVHKATLMKEDYVKLSFSDTVDYHFKAGAWVEYDGQKYFLAEDNIPTMSDEATYSYELQFNAPWYNLDAYIFLFNTYDEGLITKRESDWHITDTAANIINLIIRNTKDDSRTCPCVFDELFYCEDTEVRTFTFSKSSIVAALNSLAKEFELEWWVDVADGAYRLHFGECDNSIIIDKNGATTFNADGSRAKDATLRTVLTTGDNVSKPTINNKQGLKRFYYVFGSSRNIDQTIDVNEDGSYTSIATKRLALDNPIDKVEGAGEEVVIFDDIYPRSDYEVTGVIPHLIQSEEVAGYDDEGTPIYKQYYVFNLQIAAFSDYVFSLIKDETVDVQCIEDVIASGKVLSLKFIQKNTGTETITPKLAGFEFELGAVLQTDATTGAQWYEFQIIKQDVNGYIIPNQTLVPEVGDWVCIYNIKGAYIDGNEEYNAKSELQAEFDKYYANLKKNISYTVEPYANESIDLNIGDAVELRYKDQVVVSRIYSFEKKLDYVIDATYTISSYATQGTVNQLKEEVKTLTANIANGTAMKLDTETLQNVLRTYGGKMFLSRTSADTASGVITFKKGFEAQASSEEATTLTKNDSGWTLETDYLHVRRKFSAETVEIMHTSHVGGRLIATAGSLLVSKVDCDEADKQVDTEGNEYWPYYRCYFNTTDSDGNKIYNTFEVGDLAYCETFNLTTNSQGTTSTTYGSNHFYWRKVTAVGTDYICLSNVKGSYAAESDAPLVGDNITLLGSTHTLDDGTTDTDRQNAIVIAGAGTGNPFIRVYTGIDSFTLPTPDVQLSPTGSWIYVTDSSGNKASLYDLIQQAQEIAEGKRRVFTKKPTENDAYDKGDLWVNATYPTDDEAYVDDEGNIYTESNPLYSDDVLRCETPKTEGEPLDIAHWTPSQHYTTSVIDQKADSIQLAVTDGLKTTGIDITNGTITLNAETTTVSENLVVTRLKTSPDTSTNTDNQAHIEAAGSTMRVFGTQGQCNIEFGVDDNGMAVLKYYNDNGQLLYDLGPNGMNWIDVDEEGFTTQKYVWISDSYGTEGDHSNSTANQVSLHLFKAKRINGVVAGGDITNHDASIATAASGCWFTSQTIVSGSALDTSVLAEGLGRLPDSTIQTFDDFEKYGDINEAKIDLMNLLNLTQEQIDALDWSTDDTAAVLTLKYPIYWQLYNEFQSGRMNERYEVWQNITTDK